MAVIHGNGRATILLHVPPTFSLTHFSLLRSLTSSVRPSLRMSSHLLPSLPSSFLSPLPRSSFPRPLPWPPSPPPPTYPSLSSVPPSRLPFPLSPFPLASLFPLSLPLVSSFLYPSRVAVHFSFLPFSRLPLPHLLLLFTSCPTCFISEPTRRQWPTFCRSRISQSTGARERFARWDKSWAISADRASRSTTIPLSLPRPQSLLLDSS